VHQQACLQVGAIVAPELGDGLDVRLQTSQQPDDLDVAMTFQFQPPTRLHPVEIAVNVELQKGRGMIGRAASWRCFNPEKP
jgi:hypothetical protein